MESTPEIKQKGIMKIGTKVPIQNDDDSKKVQENNEENIFDLVKNYERK